MLGIHSVPYLPLLIHAFSLSVSQTFETESLTEPGALPTTPASICTPNSIAFTGTCVAGLFWTTGPQIMGTETSY